MKNRKPNRRWAKSETAWIVQCDGGVGLIHATNSRTRRGAIAAFRDGFTEHDPTWKELSGRKGHYRVVKVLVSVIR